MPGRLSDWQPPIRHVALDAASRILSAAAHQRPLTAMAGVPAPDLGPEAFAVLLACRFAALPILEACKEASEFARPLASIQRPGGARRTLLRSIPSRRISHGMGKLKKLKNPCVGVCKIDRSTGWCQGCWRTKAEIRQWKDLSGKARRELLDLLTKRRSKDQPAQRATMPHAIAHRSPIGAHEPPQGAAAHPTSTGAAATARANTSSGLVRHRKSGKLFAELHRGALRVDGTPMVVYRGEDGRIWVRPAAQFDDGRYEPVNAPKVQPADRSLAGT